MTAIEYIVGWVATQHISFQSECRLLCPFVQIFDLGIKGYAVGTRSNQINRTHEIHHLDFIGGVGYAAIQPLVSSRRFARSICSNGKKCQ
ncbi:hypothetical protein GB851_07750 [Kingella kingae]|nr:hypothetical protein GB851_07750 [Kingella kingae]